MNQTYINRKKVVYRKTKEGYTVRTPEGTINYGHDGHAAKEAFRKALKQYKQPYIPKPQRRQKSFAVIMASTTFMEEK